MEPPNNSTSIKDSNHVVKGSQTLQQSTQPDHTVHDNRHDILVGSPWNKLPVELKAMILEYRLRIDNAIMWRNNSSHSRRALLPLLLTNKEMRAIAARVWAEKNTFRLLFSWSDREKYAKCGGGMMTSLSHISGALDRSHFRFPHLNIASMIRTVELELTVMKIEWRRIISSGYNRKPWDLFNAWRILMSPRNLDNDPGTAYGKGKNKFDDIGWQKTLPNLNHLHIEIVMERNYYELGHCQFDYCPHAKSDLDKFFQNGYTKLRAKTVVVIVRGLKCGDYKTGTIGHTEHCSHGCATRIGRGIEKLIELKP